MKAQMGADGVLVVEADDVLEAAALRHWSDANLNFTRHHAANAVPCWRLAGLKIKTPQLAEPRSNQ